MKCNSSCEICLGDGYIIHPNGQAQICPNDPRKYENAGVELADKAIPGLLSKTQALKAIQSAMSDLIKQGYGLLYLQGTYGIGKTVCAKAFTVDAVIAYESALYQRQSEMVNYLRASFADDKGQGEYNSRLKRFREVKWLVIDEIGRDRMTDFGVESMNEIVDARYQGALKKQLMTVLISNEAPEKVFEPYIVDRIGDVKNKMLNLQAKSQRITA